MRKGCKQVFHATLNACQPTQPLTYPTNMVVCGYAGIKTNWISWKALFRNKLSLPNELRTYPNKTKGIILNTVTLYFGLNCWQSVSPIRGKCVGVVRLFNSLIWQKNVWALLIRDTKSFKHFVVRVEFLYTSLVCCVLENFVLFKLATYQWCADKIPLI